MISSLAKKFANENGFDNIDQMLKQYDLINKYLDEKFDTSRLIKASEAGKGRYNIYGNVIFQEGTESLIKLSMKNPAIKNGDIYSGVKKGTYAINNKIQFKAAWKNVYDLYTTSPTFATDYPDLYKILKAQPQDVINKMSKGYGIKGYTWHHNHIPGDFELVNTNLHEQFRHTGGDAFWGGSLNLDQLNPIYNIINFEDILFN